jgi:hypothetical protein
MDRFLPVLFCDGTYLARRPVTVMFWPEKICEINTEFEKICEINTAFQKICEIRTYFEKICQILTDLCILVLEDPRRRFHALRLLAQGMDRKTLKALKGRVRKLSLKETVSHEFLIKIFLQTVLILAFT